MGDSECVEGCVDGGEYVVTVSTGEGNCIVKTSSSGEYCTFFSFTYRCAAAVATLCVVLIAATCCLLTNRQRQLRCFELLNPGEKTAPPTDKSPV